MTDLRILVTASRRMTSLERMRTALWQTFEHFHTPGERTAVTVVHGDCPNGGDQLADKAAREYGWHVEPHPASDFAEHGTNRFRARNQHMVDLGATACVAVADRWDSGTGMCARMARNAGIPTMDWGVNTAGRRHVG